MLKTTTYEIVARFDLARALDGHAVQDRVIEVVTLGNFARRNLVLSYLRKSSGEEK